MVGEGVVFVVIGEYNRIKVKLDHTVLMCFACQVRVILFPCLRNSDYLIIIHVMNYFVTFALILLHVFINSICIPLPTYIFAFEQCHKSETSASPRNNYMCYILEKYLYSRVYIFRGGGEKD